MSNPSEMYDRAVAIAKENGFECIDLFWYYRDDENSVLGLKIQPWHQGGVSIQSASAYGYIGESEQIILNPENKALLESIIKAFAFTDNAVIQSLKIGV